MENTKIARIKKAAGVTATVLNVVKIILIVGMVMTLVAGVTVMGFRMGPEGKTVEVFGREIVVHGLVDFGDLKVDGFGFLDIFHIEDPFVLAGLNCFCATVVIAAAMVAVILLRSVFVAVKESDTPFKSEILGKLKIAAVIVTVIVLMESLGIAVIVALSFWCIYCVFDYGIELQKSADETL